MHKELLTKDQRFVTNYIRPNIKSLLRMLLTADPQSDSDLREVAKSRAEMVHKVNNIVKEMQLK